MVVIRGKNSHQTQKKQLPSQDGVLHLSTGGQTTTTTGPQTTYLSLQQHADNVNAIFQQKNT